MVVRATDGPESSTSMDYEGALKFLGLSENASSEDMVRAKNQMLARYEDEEEKLKSVSERAVGMRAQRDQPKIGCYVKKDTKHETSFPHFLSGTQRASEIPPSSCNLAPRIRLNPGAEMIREKRDVVGKCRKCGAAANFDLDASPLPPSLTLCSAGRISLRRGSDEEPDEEEPG